MLRRRMHTHVTTTQYHTTRRALARTHSDTCGMHAHACARICNNSRRRAGAGARAKLAAVCTCSRRLALARARARAHSTRACTHTHAHMDSQEPTRVLTHTQSHAHRQTSRRPCMHACAHTDCTRTVPHPHVQAPRYASDPRACAAMPTITLARMHACKRTCMRTCPIAPAPQHAHAHAYIHACRFMHSEDRECAVAPAHA